MKRLILSISVLLVAASQQAAGQQAPDPPAGSAPPPQTATGHALVTQPPADSPLVRAARSTPSRSKKKSTAKKKSAPVITNDNLLKSGGHITTAKSQPPLRNIAPAEMTPEEARAIEKRNREVREAAAAKVNKEEADRKLQKERNGAIYNGDDAEGMLEDPAVVEGKMNPKPRPEALPPPKPPLN